MLHQTYLFLGQLWQLFEVSQILEFLRYTVGLQAISAVYVNPVDYYFVIVFCNQSLENIKMKG